MGAADRAAAGAAASLAKTDRDVSDAVIDDSDVPAAAPIPVGRDRYLPFQWKYDDGAHGLCFVCSHWATWISVGNVRCIDADKLASQHLPSASSIPGTEGVV